MSDITWPVLALGLAGQALFTSRVLVQWIASERARCPVVPRSYWWLSLGGALFVLVYTFLAKNPIYALSVLPGVVIYVRNLRMARPASLAALLPAVLGLCALTAWMVILQPRTGTALMTAHRMAEAHERDMRSPQPEHLGLEGVLGGQIGGIGIHAARMDGVVADQKVVFGGPGETLSIEHRTTSRECFMPGVLLAIRSVGQQKGLIIGLEKLL